MKTLLEKLGYGVYKNSLGKYYIKTTIKRISDLMTTSDNEVKKEGVVYQKRTGEKVFYERDNEGFLNAYVVLNPLGLKKERNIIDRLFRKNRIITFEEMEDILNK